MERAQAAALSTEETQAMVALAASGDRAAGRRLVAELGPVIQRVVTASLMRVGALSRGDARQMVLDLVQQVFSALFENGARSLRQWDPARGRTLRSFAGLLAEREVWSFLRSRSRSARMEQPLDEPEETLLEGKEPAAGPESVLMNREFLDALEKRLRERQGERGILLLKLLVIEERSAEEVAAITGMTEGALYVWRTRLRRLARELADELGAPAKKASSR